MRSILDILKDVPLSAVLKERLELRDEQYAVLERVNGALKDENESLKGKLGELEKENADLRSRVSAAGADDLTDDDIRMLVRLFHAREPQPTRPFQAPVAENDESSLAAVLEMDSGTARYHLDRLAKRKLAVMSGGNYAYGHKYWQLTDQGRAYVVENKLQ